MAGFLSDAFGSLRYAMLPWRVFYVWGMRRFLRARSLIAEAPIDTPHIPGRQWLA